MIDPYGRTITYLRVSVTDRCDLRCIYCMSEDMTFLPKQDVLSLDELDRLCGAFVRLGVRKLRVTGGEPFVRRNVMELFKKLGSRLDNGLEELTLTTNGTQLAKHAAELKSAGVRRVNVSMDTLDSAKFKRLTRWGELARTLEGIEAAAAVGLHVKVNAVALRGENEDELDALLDWCGHRGHDLCLIETMPMGDVAGDRTDHYLPLSIVRARMRHRWTLTESSHSTGGPARYFDVAETGTRLGFITPMTHNFCEGCNRVRLTCTGTLYLCLGQDDAADLRVIIRGTGGETGLDEAIVAAIARKPKGHDFIIDRGVKAPSVARHMSLTGG